MKTDRSEWVATASLLMAMLLWASSFIALKIAFRAYDPMLVIFGRMAVASICFLFFIHKLKPAFFRKQDVKYILLMSLCEPCLYFLFEAKAVQNTTATQAGMITALLPLMVALSARPLLGERLTPRTYFGFVIAIGGVFWLSLSTEVSRHAPNPLLGNFLEVVAMLFAAGYTLLLKRLTASYPPFFLAAVQSLVGSLFFLPLFLLGLDSSALAFDPVPAGSIFYLGAFVTLGAYSFYNYGVSRISASRASAFVNLIPVFALVMGWIVLKERFTIWQYPASALVFVGVFISQWKGRASAAVGDERNTSIKMPVGVCGKNS